MKPDIKGIYKISPQKQEQLYEMMLRAFRNYPKLIGTFPDWDDRQAAIELTIRYYGAFDFKYGNVYSLDENMTEAMMIMFSEEEDFSDERFEAAGYNTEQFQKAAARLSEKDMQRWWDFFDEVDRREADLDIPEPCLYIDLFCVSDDVQGQGRGSKLIQTACRYADEIGLPIMLFTNGEDDIRFYMKNGFRILAVAKSEEFGFENTYVIY